MQQVTYACALSAEKAPRADTWAAVSTASCRFLMPFFNKRGQGSLKKLLMPPWGGAPTDEHGASCSATKQEVLNKTKQENLCVCLC